MNLAGQLKVLSDSDMQMVHEKALELLEEKGVVFQSDKAVETFRKHGAKVTDHTVMIPKDMVMKALSQCPPSFLLEGMNPDKNVTIGEGFGHSSCWRLSKTATSPFSAPWNWKPSKKKKNA